MSGISLPISAWAGARDAFLVTSKLDEAADLILGEALQGIPEVLDVCVRLYQADLVHGVSLRREGRKMFRILTLLLFDQSISSMVLIDRNTVGSHYKEALLIKVYPHKSSI